MTKIQGSGNDGDFVLNGQPLATKKGFKNVSKLWYDKTMSYDDGLEQLEKGIDNREDIECPLFDMVPVCDDSGKLAIKHSDGRLFYPTEHALKQLSSRIFTPQSFAKHLTNPILKQNKEDVRFERDEIDTKVLVSVLKNGYRRVEANKKFRFRTYNDSTLRAVLTEDYAPVDNRWYLEVIKDIIPDGRLSHWRGDEDTVYGNILIPDSIREEDDSDYGGMISVGNCEIGKRRISQIPSVFRAICMNGCIWDQAKGKAMRRVHRGDINLIELKKEIFTNIQTQIPLMHDGIDRLLATQSFITEKVKLSNIFAEIAVLNNFSSKETIECVSQFTRFEKGSRNLFGIINSITRAGQEFNNSQWLKLDEVGGELSNYTEAKWNRLLQRAENIDEKKLIKVYGKAALAV
jgi:hypothetical protein